MTFFRSDLSQQWVRRLPAMLAAGALCLPAAAHAQQWHDHPYWSTAASIPISGRPVPELAWLDEEMRSYMQERSIPAGVMGVMRNGRIVYLRGFGHDFNRNPLPENAPFQLASVSKPITVAAARHLIASGAIALDDFAFDRGQVDGGTPVGGILPQNLYSAPGNFEDTRVAEIRVGHLIHHGTGWFAGPHNDDTDIAFGDRECANELGVASPPGPRNKVRCILGQPLEFRPGSLYRYSNVSTLILGEVIKHVSGMSLDAYVRTHIMRWQIEIPETEIFRGRSFREWQNPREPYYKTLNRHPDTATGPWMVDNVFDNHGPNRVERPYGGHDVEMALAYGGFVASAAAMLEFANHYDVRLSIFPDSTFGMPLGPERLTWRGGHNGSLPGFETAIEQYDVAENARYRFYVAFSARSYHEDFYDEHWPGHFLNQVRVTLTGAQQTWPTQRVDGFWTRLGSELSQGVGGYHAPFRGFNRMLNQTTRGSRIRLLPGSQSWTGVLDRPMLIDAPEGVATLGAP
ncbi:MAG: serine hydrolase domain-containing protein [Lysobacteraceae bacterium]